MNDTCYLCGGTLRVQSKTDMDVHSGWKRTVNGLCHINCEYTSPIKEW